MRKKNEKTAAESEPRTKRVVRVELTFDLLFHNDGSVPVPNSAGVLRLRAGIADAVVCLLKNGFVLPPEAGTVDLLPGTKYAVSTRRPTRLEQGK